MSAQRPFRRFLVPLSIGALGVVLAGLLRYLALSVLHLQVRVPFFFLSVVFAAWFGGAPAAAVSIVLGIAGAFAVQGSARGGDLSSGIAGPVLIYLVVAIPAAYCIVALRGARDRAAGNAGLASRRLEELRLEQERTEATLGSISDGVVRVNAEGRITYLNAAAAQLAGIDRAAALGMPLGEELRLRDPATGIPLEEPARLLDEPRRMEPLLLATSNDAAGFPVEVRASPAPGGDTVITLHDVTERTRAEKMRAESEQRFRAMADSAPVLIWMSTPSTGCDYVNRPWLEFTGRTLEDVLGEGWLESVHPEDLDRVRGDLAEAMEVRRSFALEYRLRGMDGQYHWIFDRGVPRFAANGEFLGYIGSAVDVTERKQAEGRYRAIVETANEGVWMISPSGETLYANDRMATMLGCAPGELSGKSVLDFCFERDKEDARDRIAANFAGYAESFDSRFRRVDGAAVYTLACTSPVRDGEGSISGALGMFSDVTDRRRATAALRESEERFRQLAETIEDVFWIYDLASERVVYASPAYERLWGRSRQALLRDAREWLAAVHPEDLEHVEAALERQIQGGSFDEEYRIVRPDGSTVWIRDRGFPVMNAKGVPYRSIGIAEDITARRNAEMAVRESEAKLRALLESASQGVVASDEMGRIVLVNARTEEMFGYSRSELVGQPVEMLLPEQARAPHRQHRAEFMLRGRNRPMAPGNYLAGRRKTGEEFPVEISLSYLSEDGSRMALALVTDVTERKRFEEQLQETAKLESLGVLAGGIAHDFNNILTGIMGNASMAMDVRNNPAEVRELLESVVQSSERAAHLTHQMLAYSGRGRFIVQPVNLSSLVSDITDLLRGSVSRTVQLVLDLHPDPPLVEADIAQMHQLAINLVLNAAEAIGDRHGVVTVRTGVRESGGQANLAGNDLAPGEYAFLEVQDNGCGMDEETRTRMFDPFFTTKFTGRGLGLAATLGIVRGHHGGIRVDTAPGQGTTVTVLLPAFSGRLPESEPAAPRPSAAAGAVLVVDDEEVVRRTASAALTRAGYEVLLAENGQAAIEIFPLSAGRIVLVILDMTMPVMSGEETLARIRAINPNVPVLISSGYSELEAHRRFQGQVVSGFAQKPYTAAGLVEQVNAIVSGGVAPRLVESGGGTAG